ncbi:PREDICTED: non-canonical poly(A) RNA polymerase PAPD5 [Tarenaya hassleriana]|uniref:non-canonical poly(A) RNA polymerase PAPD5 n=1 Tax=Tarenaya hassleriana TaxID=28532 RepID=UPI00053C0D4C|nr:PREDICTED: non-canonical poly(A) RNA polymerase PAPD5 [Tarenaya hassleriana]
MDTQTETRAPTFVYHALSPLSFPLSDQSTPLNQSPDYDDSQRYSVFRNEISLSTLDPTSVASSAPDFFSLDVGAGPDGPDPVGDRFEGAEPATPVVSTKKNKKRKKGGEAEEKSMEPMLESNWFSGNSCSKIPMLQLHKEIVEFCEFLSPTQEERAKRDEAVESVLGVIKYIWPSCKVEVFGSYRTGLYLPTSDIDVVILESGITKPQLGLRALSKALAQRGIAKNIQVIGKARVPIIKFVEKKSDIAFDLSFDMDNGPKAAEFIQDAVSRWPPLRPLCLILKVFLQQRELNEVYSGGIGSYALLAMLITFLKFLNDGRTSPEHNLGVLLVKFFDLYGRKLNTIDVGISCKMGGSFYSKSSKGFVNNNRPGLISIEDPQAPENDVGKNSFNYFQIRSAFAMAFSTLSNAKTIQALGQNRSILGTIIRPDPVLLQRKGGQNGDVTFSTLLPGAGEPLHTNGQSGGLFCNWQLDGEDDEPFPRGHGLNNGDVSAIAESSRKKRRASSRKKKKGEGGDAVASEPRGEREVSSKKRRGRKLKQKNPIPTTAMYQWSY